MQEDHEAGDGEYAKRQVDPENPGPGEIVDDDAAGKRADDSGDRPDAGKRALHFGSLFELVEIADDGHRDRLDSAGAEALQQPENDQGSHRPGEAGERRADEKDDDAADQHGFAAENIGKLAIDDGGGGLRQQKGGKDPAIIGEAAELADDARHGGRDDGRFDGDHEGRKHDRDDDQRASRMIDRAGHGIPF